MENWGKDFPKIAAGEMNRIDDVLFLSRKGEGDRAEVTIGNHLDELSLKIKSMFVREDEFLRIFVSVAETAVPKTVNEFNFGSWAKIVSSSRPKEGQQLILVRSKLCKLVMELNSPFGGQAPINFNVFSR